MRRAPVSSAEPPPRLPSGNPCLPTPAAYEELLTSRASSEAITIVRYGAPWCRSCRTFGSDLQALALDRHPTDFVHEMSLVRDGKAAGERLFKHFKDRLQGAPMPFFEVYRGAELIDRLDGRALGLISAASTVAGS